MGKSRYRPRDYCDEPELFGLSWDVQFGPLTVDELPSMFTDNQRTAHMADKAYVYASQLQHEYAFVIRHILDVRGLTYTDYAKLVGGTSRRQAGVLRGEYVMRSDDFERADQGLGGVHLARRVYGRQAKLREIQAAIAEIERDSQPWPEADIESQAS